MIYLYIYIYIISYTATHNAGGQVSHFNYLKKSDDIVKMWKYEEAAPLSNYPQKIHIYCSLTATLQDI